MIVTYFHDITRILGGDLHRKEMHNFNTSNFTPAQWSWWGCILDSPFSSVCNIGRSVVVLEDPLYYWKINCMIISPGFNEVERGVYWYHLVHLSVCPSVRLWTESCPLCIFNNTHRIHFIFAHLIKQLQKVCRVQCPFQNSKIWNFGEFFKFVTLTLSSFDLGSNMTQWYR